MSLRTRLILTLSALILVLTGLGWWWLDGMTDELEGAAAELALSTAEALLAGIEEAPETIFGAPDELPPDEEPPPEPPLPGWEEPKIALEGGQLFVGPEGMVVIEVADDPVLEAAVNLRQRLLLGALAILLLGVVSVSYVAHRVTAPLQSLAVAAEAIRDGRLGEQVAVGGDAELRRTLDAFNAMSRRLEASEREAAALRERAHLGEIGEIARGVAHALRNPLNTVGLTLDRLDAEAAALEPARVQLRRMDHAIRSFLALAAGAEGAVEPVALDAVARDVALELVQGPSGVGVSVEADGPVVVAGVAPELRALLHVLVVNAVEASAAGAEVTVRVERDGEGARAVVEDRGSGLPDAVRGRLFSPHVTTKADGAGMGLFLARRIAASRYGGCLELADREGGGTRATLTLGARRDV